MHVALGDRARHEQSCGGPEGAEQRRTEALQARAHGERIRDDQSLLKKTLKRKTNEKTKSATQWNERIDNVAKGKQAKDKRREENLAKRRDEKMAKKTGGHGKKTSAGKKKGRPGFEGRFKA